MEIQQVIILRKDKVFGNTALNLKGLCNLTSKASIQGFLHLFGKFQYKTLRGGLFDPGQTYYKYEAEFGEKSLVKQFLDKPDIAYYCVPQDDDLYDLQDKLLKAKIPCTMITEQVGKTTRCVCLATAPYAIEKITPYVEKLQKM